MPAWFKRGLSPHLTALAMIGAKSGDRVAVLGEGDPDLIAELALKTGLNGQTVVLDAPLERRAAIDAAAGQAGSLVEYQDQPTDDQPCDIVVLLAPIATLDATDRAARLKQAMDLLRSGGRVIVIDGGKPAGRFGMGRRAPRLPTETVLQLLEAAGARAHRQLADVDGVVFYEGQRH